jgi:hypothetical protein
VGCFLILLGLISPRLVLFCLWLFTNYLSRAFDSWFWPTLGFLFLPMTTLAYAVAENEFHGLDGIGLVILLVGFAADLGLFGFGARSRRRS